MKRDPVVIIVVAMVVTVVPYTERKRGVGPGRIAQDSKSRPGMCFGIKASPNWRRREWARSGATRCQSAVTPASARSPDPDHVGPR